MARSRISTISLAAAIVAVVAIAGTAGAASPASSGIRVIKDSDLRPHSVAVGGASVLPTTRTVQHWHGSTVDPHNGVTYGYNMVGANPNSCVSSACSSTVTVDITPINIVVGGHTFNGSDVLAATLASPQFTATDFTTTPRSTVPVLPEFLANGTVNPAYDPTAPGYGAGGALSAGNANVQLEDATMRSQFNKVGSDPYHLRLSPNVRSTVTITVPSNQGVLLQNVRGVIFPAINISWW
jgi:hypothetical protein